MPPRADEVPNAVAAKAHMFNTIATNDALRAVGSQGLAGGIKLAEIGASNAGLQKVASSSSEITRS